MCANKEGFTKGCGVDVSQREAVSDCAAGRVAYAPAWIVEWVEASKRMSEEMRFFHGELEFRS